MSRGSFWQIAVGGDDVAPACVGETGSKRRSLTEVPAEANDSEPRVRPLQLDQPRKRIVGAAVVDRENLVRTSERAQHRRQLGMNPPHVG